MKLGELWYVCNISSLDYFRKNPFVGDWPISCFYFLVSKLVKNVLNSLSYFAYVLRVISTLTSPEFKTTSSPMLSVCSFKHGTFIETPNRWLNITSTTNLPILIYAIVTIFFRRSLQRPLKKSNN